MSRAPEKTYIAVDCGKYNTKTAMFRDDGRGMVRKKFRTKFSPGTFDDDMFGRGTYIIQIDDGPVYKVGNEGRTEPDMETTKKTEIHAVCTMAGIAAALGEGDHKDVSVVIGIPLQLATIPEERLSYKSYILGEPGQHTVRLKADQNGPVVTVKFTITSEKVYPEGMGVLYEYPDRLDGPTAIIDIGNLNTNNTYADRFNINSEACFTDELGGKVLISGLAQELTSELGSRVDDNLAASTLLKPYGERFLVPANGDPEIQKRSREIIDRYLLDHVNAIKKKCDTHHWPLAFMRVVCIGGTSRLLSGEIRAVFGQNAFIPDNPEYVNACGFLRKLCADSGVDITDAGKGKQQG